MQAADDPAVVHEAIALSDERMQRWSSGGITIIEVMHGDMTMSVLRNGVLIKFEEYKKQKRRSGAACRGARIRRS